MQYESGFKPVTGQLLQGTNWDLFPWAFCRSEQGNTLLLSFPPLPQACAAQVSHYSCPGQGCSWSPFQHCWQGMGDGAQCCAPLLTAPIPSARAALGKQSPHFLCTRMQPMLVVLAWEELCQWLLCSSAGYRHTQHVGPSCPEAFHTSGQGV